VGGVSVSVGVLEMRWQGGTHSISVPRQEPRRGGRGRGTKAYDVSALGVERVGCVVALFSGRQEQRISLNARGGGSR
jgi:hypothetical protein